MIHLRSVKHRGLKNLLETGRSDTVPASLIGRIRNRLAALDAMKTIGELPPSYRAHLLVGKRRGTWAIRVNGPWRLTFKFDSETVFDLDLEQYHQSNVSA